MSKNQGEYLKLVHVQTEAQRKLPKIPLIPVDKCTLTEHMEI